MRISGSNVINSGIGGATTAVDIVNTGAPTANALVVHGDTILYPENNNPATQDVMLTIGDWDFKALTNGRLCVRYVGNPIGYFAYQGPGVPGRWIEATSCN
jgi:hypothetical protein